MLWNKPSIHKIMGCDTEYVSFPDKQNTMITSQIATSSTDCAILEHPELKLGILPSWDTLCILPTVLGWKEDFDECQEPNMYLLWEVLCFFAPADILAGLFNNKQLCLYVQQHLKQDGRITIDNGSNKKYDRNRDKLKLPVFLTNPDDEKRYQIVLKVTDLSKIGSGGLKSIGQSLGVKMPDKNKMDAYKSNMLVPYQEEKLLPEYIEYANSDATVLFEIREAVEARQRLLYDTVGVPMNDKIFYTAGSLVANLFYDWLQILVDEEAGEEKPGYECFRTNRDEPWKFETLLEQAGVSHFASRGSEFTAQANALVQGGRAKNERPTVISNSGVIADADFSSCYGTILENLTYPIGLPTVHFKHKSEKKTTLGKFLKDNEAELIPRLYTIVVSGHLNHSQTLVPSKIIDEFDICEKYDADNPKIPADFRLYTSEIINGVITSDVLEALKACCNRNEWASWMKLEVITASYYPRSLQIADLTSWNEALNEYEKHNTVRAKTSKKGHTVQYDTRSRLWCGIQIADFITPFKEKRGKLKARRNELKKASDEWAKLNAEQEGLKLVINTLYGVIASPYKVISNVVIANNITAGARVACWCLSTSTGAFQSITDGAAYNLNQVRDWSGEKLPSMNTLSIWRNPEYLQRRETGRLYTRPLASETEWALTTSEIGSKYSLVSNGSGTVFEAKEEGWDYFDKKLIEHIKHFFRSELGYPSILDVFQITHKDIYQSIVIHSQTNYLLKHIGGEIKVKARGHKVKGSRYNNETENSNILLLFDDLQNNPNSIPAYKPQTISQILKVNQANKLLGAKTPNVVQRNGLLAGDSISKPSWVRPISLSLFHWQNDKQFKAWARREAKLKDKTGYGLEHYFRNPDGTVDYQRAVTHIQDKIDAGWNWIVSSDKNRFFKEHPWLTKE